MPLNPDELRAECIQCGRAYFARRTDARYCSNACRQRAYDQRQRELKARTA